jgi:hypothetical protein
MRHTTISGHRGAHDAQAAVFWILGGIIMMIAFRDVLTLLAVALGIVATAWWISREVERRMERNDAARRRAVTNRSSESMVWTSRMARG